MRAAVRIITIQALVLAIVASVAAASTMVRIKDIAKFKGVRVNQLLGYGLVVGLAGTGDGSDTTKQAVGNMMERLGIVVPIDGIDTDNVAAVLVTANLPAFAKPTSTIDVVVSSIGDADSLQGGTLIMTPLQGADGRVYAVAQGPISLGGWTEGRATGRNSKGHPTVARIPNGATVEREVHMEIAQSDEEFLILNNPDSTTATNIVEAINALNGEYGTAKAVDSSTIEITPPLRYVEDRVTLRSDIENLQVKQDHISKVVINEKTGTIVIGFDVAINPVYIAHGPLTVKVDTQTDVSQPLPFSGGQTLPITQQQVQVDESKVNLKRVLTGELVDALNRMRVTASDIIAIFQALKASGALQADLEII